MTTTVDAAQLATRIDKAIDENSLSEVASLLSPLSPQKVADVLERLGRKDRAVAFRLLSKDNALAVFESLDASLQGELIHDLQDEQVTGLFAELDPDDRVTLLDELPASVAARLLHDLPEDERAATATLLGYPQGSVGREMTPEFVSVHPEESAEQALAEVRAHIDEVETIYGIPVVGPGRVLEGIVGLRGLMRSAPDVPVRDIMNIAEAANARQSAESAARRCAEHRLLVMPIVDGERRLVGILTVDDALRILEEAESEDAARQGGVEPLNRPYLSTPVMTLVRSRVVWLLVLAIGATLTVKVLSVFEDSLQEMVVLSLFVPLIIGTGGNTGNQAATTVTRALALGDITTRDALRVLGREVRVGATLGFVLGSLGMLIAGVLFGMDVGLVIGATLLGVCTMSAAVGGLMPIVAKSIGVDPAVFSNPFISTFVDATGLILYFLIARAILGI
ncbi:magnesium transporter [Tsukamurella sp. 1534]|uniref:magnesium transporter n=1 Tax=Tsukamurella sp. 1534 TaxID=1151061 RepID=UPI0009DA0801|nr:magnesium transporter [Tsukamurella sp. 1534]